MYEEWEFELTRDVASLVWFVQDAREWYHDAVVPMVERTKQNPTKRNRATLASMFEDHRKDRRHISDLLKELKPRFERFVTKHGENHETSVRYLRILEQGDKIV